MTEAEKRDTEATMNRDTQNTARTYKRLTHSTDKTS